MAHVMSGKLRGVLGLAQEHNVREFLRVSCAWASRVLAGQDWHCGLSHAEVLAVSGRGAAAILSPPDFVVDWLTVCPGSLDE